MFLLVRKDTVLRIRVGVQHAPLKKQLVEVHKSQSTLVTRMETHRFLVGTNQYLHVDPTYFFFFWLLLLFFSN